MVITEKDSDKFKSSRYEKLTFPFDYHTWFLIFFTFVAAYLVILIVNFASF
jgi:hypothetical protein